MNVMTHIRVVGARVHNLKNVSVDIPRRAVTVITGVSGSGKSSLAFDTIHAEGQRRYLESLSVYARQFLEQLQKPDVERIDGLSPTVAIEQRVTSPGPRSTVATTTEIHDFLRVLFARVGQPCCPKCHRAMVAQSVSGIVTDLLNGAEGRKALILAPLIAAERGSHEDRIKQLIRDGLVRARIDGEVVPLEGIAPLPPNEPHTLEAVIDRLVLKEGAATRAAESVELAARLGGGRVLVSEEIAPQQWRDRAFSTVLSCPDHPDARLDELNPRLFSFNAPQGACPRCTGLGCTLEFDPDLVIPDRRKSLNEGAVAAWRQLGPAHSGRYARVLRDFCRDFQVSADLPISRLPEPIQRLLVHGTTPEQEKQFGAAFEGILPDLRRLWAAAASESLKERLHAFLAESPCEACGGSRLRPEALCVRLRDRTIADVARMNVAQAARWCEQSAPTGEAAAIAEPLLREVRSRLAFLAEVGVEYLTLDRPAATLSGGEWQRLRLATQLGGGLSGLCYILDEPTIGLHPRDSRKLSEILHRLAARDNTVIVVEHDPEVIRGADYLLDVGPGAGEDGGRIMARGTPQDVCADPNSLTGRFLSDPRAMPIPDRRRSVHSDRILTLHGAAARNLKNVTVRVPLGLLVCITGVSGSGKSSLVSQVLVRAIRRSLTRGGPRPGPHRALDGAEAIQQVVEIEQAPLIRSTRGNPATHAGVLTPIRELFARTREARIRGYGPSRFSFNNPGGRCARCAGRGVRRIIMHFLPDVLVPCEECGGKRYNRETLDIRYRGRSMADVLDMRVDQACAFFENFENIRRRLLGLKDVGLGYLALGQPTATLSGGEAQRLKLASELHRGGAGHTLYVLDEPTMGLHFADVRRLLDILHRLVERGNTVLCVEHHLDVIKCADWVIDLGPEGGEAGGYLVAEGTPEQVAACAESHTGRFLRAALTDPVKPAPPREPGNPPPNPAVNPASPRETN